MKNLNIEKLAAEEVYQIKGGRDIKGVEWITFNENNNLQIEQLSLEDMTHIKGGKPSSGGSWELVNGKWKWVIK